MTDQKSGQHSGLMDFDALYRGQGASIGEDGPRLDVVPWQLDGPQPLVVELAEAGEFTGPILECGCGLGDNALYLAERGHRITAVDAAPSVIERDRAKAAARGLDVTFAVADATELAGIGGGFNSALDSALFHCLTDEQRRDYLAALHRVCEPGASLHILCFPDAVNAIFPIPGHTDEASLRRDIGQHWRIDRMRLRRYTTNMTREQALGVVPGTAFVIDDDSVDDQGRILLPVWQIRAVRG